MRIGMNDVVGMMVSGRMKENEVGLMGEVWEYGVKRCFECVGRIGCWYNYGNFDFWYNLMVLKFYMIRVGEVKFEL